MPTPPVKLVATLADLTAEALPAARADALRSADLVEFRLDRLPALPMAEVLGEAATRAIVTMRPVREGGCFEGEEAAREARLREALRSGAAFVDIEWDAAFGDAVIAEYPGRVVLSRHDFGGMPADLPGLVRELAARRPAVVKLAVTPARLTDQLAFRGGQRRRVRHAGRADRDGGHRPAVAHPCPSGSVRAGPTAAPRLLRGRCRRTSCGARYRVGQHGAGTQVFGVAGRPIGHSWSPTLHNAALQALGIDGVYVPFEAQDIDDLLQTAEALGVRGLSVTAPFKLDALARASSADDLATRLGAANTLTRTDAGWVARNTDVEGFLHPLRSRMSLAGARVAVLGAGGAARAVVAGLHDEQAQVTVYARRREQADALVPLGATVGEWPPPAGSWDLLVNTTPVGTARPASPALVRRRARRHRPTRRRSRPACSRAAASCTTSCTTPAARACCARPRPRAARHSAASRC